MPQSRWIKIDPFSQKCSETEEADQAAALFPHSLAELSREDRISFSWLPRHYCSPENGTGGDSFAWSTVSAEKDSQPLSSKREICPEAGPRQVWGLDPSSQKLVPSPIISIEGEILTKAEAAPSLQRLDPLKSSVSHWPEEKLTQN